MHHEEALGDEVRWIHFSGTLAALIQDAGLDPDLGLGHARQVWRLLRGTVEDCQNTLLRLRGASNLLHAFCLTNEVVRHQVETIDSREELLVFREVGREGLAEQEKQIHEVEDEAIGGNGRLREHFLLVHIEEDGLTEPF